MSDQIILVMGAVLFACGLGAYVSPTFFRKTLGDFTTNLPIVYFVAIVNIAVGLFIILNLNNWVTLSDMLLSFLGWAAVVRGFIMIVAPKFFIRVFKFIWLGKGHLIGEAVVMMLIGALLIYLAVF